MCLVSVYSRGGRDRQGRVSLQLDRFAVAAPEGVHLIKTRQHKSVPIEPMDQLALGRCAIPDRYKQIEKQYHAMRLMMIATGLMTNYLMNRTGESIREQEVVGIFDLPHLERLSEVIGGGCDQSKQLPIYDPVARELRVGDVVIRRYGKLNFHEKILQAFQDAGWEKGRIRIPGFYHSNPDRLRETIDQLNTPQKDRPMLIRFRLHGKDIVWEWR
jgi:hypothetical protein